MRRYDAREARFSNRTLLNYAATNLPETLAFFRAQDDRPAEILLYDEIGFWGITAKDFVLALAQCGNAPIKLRINSPGGDVFDGLAIYNALKSYPAPVHCVIDGLAASAASFIALAGSDLVMAEASMLMIHNAWGLVVGDRHDMLDTASVLQKIDTQLAGLYAAKSGQPIADIAAKMDAETWFTAAEAKTLGLCDLVESAPPAAAARARSLPRAGLRNLSTRLRAAALPAYDPDGDGDNDAQEALTLIGAAADLLDDAADALTGTEDDDEPGEAGAGENAMPVVPGARRRRATRAAATPAEWVVGAAEDLPIDESGSWDGPAAAERMLDDAGFNGASPDPAKAKRGFLVWDHHNPKLKGSYKLPFADLSDGDLKAVKGGIDAAASRLPQTDIPEDVKTRARAVLDHYETRMKPDDKAALLARQRRLRLAQAEIV